MPKKEVKNGEKTEAKTPKRAARKDAAVKAGSMAPAKRTAALADKKPRKAVQRVAEKNAKTENGTEDRKYFAKWTEKDFRRTGEEAWFYRASLVAAALGMLWAAYDRNLLTFFTFFMLVVVVLFELRWESRDVEYEVNMDGISIDGKLYHFDEIKSFEITKKGDFDVAKFQLKNSIFPVREIYFDAEQDLPFMRALLKHFLAEETQEEKLFNFTEKEKKLTEEEYIDKKVNEYLKGKI